MLSSGQDRRRTAIREAAGWLALLESGAAGEREHQQLQEWRQAHAEHERAWQAALALQQRFAAVPSRLAMASLQPADRGRRTAMRQLLGLAVVVPTGWWLTQTLPLDAWTADLSTATGERRTLTLADGSLLQLNTATAVDLDPARRRLTLVQGELSLQVPSAEAMTLDTRFGVLTVRQAEVCVHQHDEGCDVRVVSGSVGVRPLKGLGLELGKGQQLRLSALGIGAIEPFSATLLSWRQGVLIAQDQPLGEFLEEFSRYRLGLLRWDPAVANLRVTGSFQLADTDRVLTLLAATLPLEVHWRTRFWVTLQPRTVSV
ncbi:FecR domain-containing protein [Pseudomonas benzopyrenica]|uniref:Sugar ABC transporter substrate-binding protein n=2 Tax=Pseudomonas TaxID=286 RepID=A0A178LB51_9PSED|nr:FecR domain-containing protein [Pseudomonas oryzihabitans]MCD4863860.1 FecR domain-containing protein [Pseudomonas sp. PLB05]OAN26641.1 sugar ABC transporter substrate-binding protein [Pseudomonas oryzihabitans]